MSRCGQFVLALTLACVATGCSTVAPLKTADPTPASGREWMIAYSASLVTNCDSEPGFDGDPVQTCSGETATAPNLVPDYGLRVGLTDNADVGFRVSSGAAVDVMWRVYVSELVSVSVDPTFSFGGLGLNSFLSVAQLQGGILATWHLAVLDLTTAVTPILISHPRYNGFGLAGTLGWEYAWEPGFVRVEVTHTDYTLATWDRADPLDPELRTTTFGAAVGWRFGGR